MFLVAYKIQDSVISVYRKSFKKKKGSQQPNLKE